jgi:hypothetical protein
MQTASKRANDETARVLVLGGKKAPHQADGRQSVSAKKKKGSTRKSTGGDAWDDSSNHSDGNDHLHDNEEEDDDTTIDKSGRVFGQSITTKKKITEDDIEENEDMISEIHDFCWKTVAKRSGYLVVTFADTPLVKKNMEMKDMLHDVPSGMVLRFMWEKYLRSKQTMSYVERCAKGDMILDGEKKKVFGGFRCMEHFLS